MTALFCCPKGGAGHADGAAAVASIRQQIPLVYKPKTAILVGALSVVLGVFVMVGKSYSCPAGVACMYGLLQSFRTQWCGVITFFERQSG